MRHGRRDEKRFTGEAMNGVYQAPVRKEIVMHSNDDWRAMLGNVGGGA